MTVLIPYIRQSRKKERTISIDEQRRVVEQWAAANKVTLGREVVEQGVSGSKPWRERALGAVIDACERGEAAGVVVAFQDRLSRENGLGTAEVWEALDRAGARLVAAGEGLDTATGDQELLFTIKAAIARDQWKRFKTNFESARADAVSEGKFPGRAPFGYRGGEGKPLEVIPAEAATVRAMFAARAAGEPATAIARRLGFAHSTVRQRLACETYLGIVRHGGFVNENAHEPIIDRNLFDAVQAAKTTIAAITGDTTRDRLLIGIARCSGCGRTLKTVRAPRKNGPPVVSYFCKNAAKDHCPNRAFVRAEELDGFVSDWFESALSTVPRMVDVVAAGRDLQTAQTELARLKADLDKFVVMEIDDPALFQKGLDARRARVAAAEEKVRQLAAHRSRLPVGGPLIGLWSDFSALERRSVLAGLLDHVEVDRGASRGLDGHVRIFWADGTLADDEQRVRVAAA